MNLVKDCADKEIQYELYLINDQYVKIRNQEKIKEEEEIIKSHRIPQTTTNRKFSKKQKKKIENDISNNDEIFIKKTFNKIKSIVTFIPKQIWGYIKKK